MSDKIYYVNLNMMKPHFRDYLRFATLATKPGEKCGLAGIFLERRFELANDLLQGLDHLAGLGLSFGAEGQ